MNDVLNKVRKIFAKATNNPFPEEAQTAMLKAQEIMTKHGLTIAEVNTFEPATNGVTDQEVATFRRIPWWQSQLSSIIADNFRCYSYISHYKSRGSCINFIGLSEDVELAKTVFGFAVNAIKYHADLYVNKAKKTGTYVKGIRNDYILGFLLGLKDKFEEQVKHNEWALVLAKDSAVTEAYKRLNLRKGRATAAKRAGISEAVASGYRQGKSFQPAAGSLPDREFTLDTRESEDFGAGNFRLVGM